MFIRLKKNRAQSTLEYAILIGVIVAGLVAMQVYLKRGYQGKLRESADSMGEQFSPGQTTYQSTTSTRTSSSETAKEGSTVTEIGEQKSSRDSTEKLGEASKEKWF
jgi:uncharacterized protein (UPF0333 family)